MVDVQELLKNWNNVLLNAIDKEVDENVKMKLMDYFGRACAQYCGSVDVVKQLRKSVQSIDELLDILN